MLCFWLCLLYITTDKNLGKFLHAETDVDGCNYLDGNISFLTWISQHGPCLPWHCMVESIITKRSWEGSFLNLNSEQWESSILMKHLPKRLQFYYFFSWNRGFYCHMLPSCLFWKELHYIVSKVLLFGHLRKNNAEGLEITQEWLPKVKKKVNKRNHISYTLK